MLNTVMQLNGKCDTMDRLKLQKEAIDKIKQLYSFRYDMGFVPGRTS